MKSEKVVFCQMVGCPHHIDGVCFADEIHLKRIPDTTLYCKTHENAVKERELK